MLVVLVLLIVVVAGCLWYANRRVGWTRRTFPNKTAWDWLELLVIPVALALIALGFNILQSNREQKHEDARRIADARIAEEARRDEALTAYLEQMEDLTLRHGLTSPARTPSRVHRKMDVLLLAQTLTLTVLRRLDGRRKAQVVLFLVDAGLAGGHTVSLERADLRGLDLRNGILDPFLIPQPKVILDGADLRRADFRGAWLSDVSFYQADLRGADFSGAHLKRTDLTKACLSNARFVRADLSESILNAAIGHHVDFTGAFLTHNTVEGTSLTQLKLDGIKGSDGADSIQRSVTHPMLSPQDQDSRCDAPIR